jgi:signal transduction histidine kinase
MSGLPIRLRLTLAFAVAMAVVLAAAGTFVYLRLSSSLDEAANETLAARLADASTVARTGRTGRTASDEGFTEITRVGRSRIPDVRELDSVPGVEGRVRIARTVVRSSAGGRTVVVGTSLSDRDEALRSLLVQLLIAAPIALLASALLAYWLAAAALRPVEAMRLEAAAISGAEPARRLPVGRARDEISRLAETLNAMLGRLEDALDRERSFVADASHELRTPIALLKAELELALARPRDPVELEAALRSAADETDRLVRLAEDLLVLAQADESGLPLRRSPVEAGRVLESVRDAFATRAVAEGRAVEADAADGLPLDADRLRLEQALGNLVDNALRHGAGPVLLRANRVDGRVELHVLDEGPGFPAALLPHAFERFRRGDEARSGSGAGLGLALAALVAEAHGGSAGAANREGGGADVWLSLPR